MARFNSPTESNRVENLAGGESFKESPKLEFVSILLTSFVQNQYYKSKEQGLLDLIGLFDNIDPLFMAKSAIYARREFGMRSITHVVAAELAKRVKGEEWTKRFYDEVIYRVDDMTEIVSYYLSKYKHPIPNSLKKGLRRAFDKFDSYQISKYRAEGKTVSLVDIVNLVHPIPCEKNAEALSKLVKGTLTSTETWETKLTQAGQKAETEEEKEEMKKDAWQGLLLNDKLGYFALLRNLRNIFEQAPEMIEEACRQLVSEKSIKKALIFPFNYMRAYGEIRKMNGTRNVLSAISRAVDISLSNCPAMADSIAMIDNSGSMHHQEGFGYDPATTACIFGATMYKKGADLISFSDDAKYVECNELDTTISIAKELYEESIPSGTNFRRAFNILNRSYKRIIILSDMQAWMGYHAPTDVFANYKTKYNCSPKIYSIDLAGFGTLSFPEEGIFALAGFSDKIFSLFDVLEKDKRALIRGIEEIEIC